MDNDSANESEQEVTVEEYMEKQAAEEESADLVLGGDEGKECTYNEGYMPRQAVFSCLTCAPQGNAGVCTACSLTCHDGHEIVELWTKRHFRCDCGNSKFGTAECKLWKEKEAQNKDNAYNQNFLGLYCTCSRRYPDPEDADLGEMLQCCICEDWFHEAHLGLEPSEKVPRDEEGEVMFDELICPSCIGRCSFLSRYPDVLVHPAEAATHESTEGTVEKNSTSSALEQDKLDPSKEAGNHQQILEVKQSPAPLSTKSVAVMTKDEAECSQTDKSVCKFKDVPADAKEARHFPEKALFLDRNWRTELCKCDSCSHTYEYRGVSFLLDKMDSLQNYEAMAKQKRKNKLEQAEGAGLKLLQDLNHVQKMEFLHGVNDMTSELSTFFASFRDSGKTVTSTDIYEFFERLNKKRRRVS